MGTTIQSTDLMRFMTNIYVSPEGVVSINLLEEDQTGAFVSVLYEPTFTVSALARVTHKLLKTESIREASLKLPPNTLTSKLLNSQLKTEAVDIYTLAQTVVLEAFSLVYHIREDRRGLRFMTIRDMRRVRENLNYIGDFFGTRKEYYHLIEDVRNMNIALGYIEHQIEAIQNTRAVR